MVLIGCIVLVYVWPTGGPGRSIVYGAYENDVIQMEEIMPTSQSQDMRPPPPAPLPPLVVPDNTIIEEPIEFADASLPIDEPGEDARRQEGTAQAVAMRTPDTNARLLRYAEPDYPASARKDKLRARLVVEVQVNERGQVEEAAVIERHMSTGNRPMQPVDQVGHGLEAAAVEAARRCLFRPARAGGEPVATRTTLTISFGE